MEAGIRFELIWNDSDILQVRISVSNGNFAGGANVYVPTGGLAETAEKLDGFPRSTTDRREISFGDFGPQVAGGAARFRFHCKDGAGHSFVECWLESDWQTDDPESVHLFVPAEAAAVDTFVSELRELNVNLSGTARLTSR